MFAFEERHGYETERKGEVGFDFNFRSGQVFKALDVSLLLRTWGVGCFKSWQQNI